MQYARMIHDYLDGELENSSEQNLFRELSVNQDLRAEFKQQVQVQVLAQTDMLYINTPSEATDNIYSSLGFSVPSSGYLNNNKLLPDSDRLEKFSYLKKYFSNIITALVSVLLTSLYFSMTKEEPINSGNMAQAKNNEIPVVRSYEPDNKASVDNLGKNYSNSLNNNETNKSISKNNNTFNVTKIDKSNSIKPNNQNTNSNNVLAANYSNSTNSNDNKNYGNNNNNENNNLMLIEPSKNFIRENSTFNLNNNSNVFNNYAIPKTLILIPIFQNQRLSFSLRTISAKSSPSVDVPNSSNQLLSNMSLSVLYHFDNYNSLGIEAGQEQFPQKFTATDINGEQLVHIQNPMLLWYGLLYKFTAVNFTFANSFVPYGQIFGGTNSIGFLGRVQLGLQYNYDSKLSFFAGVEGSRLFYKVQGVNYQSDKLGISYGINFKY